MSSGNIRLQLVVEGCAGDERSIGCQASSEARVGEPQLVELAIVVINGIKRASQIVPWVLPPSQQSHLTIIAICQAEDR